MLTLLKLLTLHFVADFVFQTDRMALNKSTRWSWLLAHVSAYSAGFLLYGWRFAAITFALHFVQDAITSRMTARLWAALEGHWFFVVIGLDQLLHAYALAFTWWLVFTRLQ